MTGPMSLLGGLDRCAVMGIVNVTTDSFSDGGQYLRPGAALTQAEKLVCDGADFIDVGGESTRPGAIRVTPDDELSRVLPVVRELASAGVRVSVDTMRADVAEAALAAGAAMINDVSAGLADDRMLSVCAAADRPLCLMHWRTDRFVNASGRAAVADIVADVRGFLLERIDAAVAAGVAPNNIIIDPGLGFAKNAEDNWQLLRNLDVLIDLEFPVLVAASRKRFLASLRTRPDGSARTPAEADAATAAVSALAAQAGAWAVRVHDAAATRDAVEVAAAFSRGAAPDGRPAADGDYPTAG